MWVNTKNKKTFSFGVFMLFSILTFVSETFAQQSLADGKGEGTLLVADGGFIQFNAAAPSIRVAYLREVTTHKLSFGVSASGKLTGGSGSILGNNGLAPNAEVGFSIGRRNLFTKEIDTSSIRVSPAFVDAMQKVLRKKKTIGEAVSLPSVRELQSSLRAIKSTYLLPDPPSLSQYFEAIDQFCAEAEKKDSFCVLNGVSKASIYDLPQLKKFKAFDRLTFQGKYSFHQYNLFDPTAPFASQLTKKDFHSPSAEVIYTRYIGGGMLFGASIGMEKANNSGDLTEVDIRDFMTTTSGPTTREFGRTRKALLGDFRQYTRAFVNADFAVFPKQFKRRIGVNLFARSEIAGENKGVRPGIGIFLSEKGAPTKVIGGVSFSVDNNGKANVALTAGYNF